MECTVAELWMVFQQWVLRHRDSQWILGVYCGQTTDSVPAMGTVCHRDSQWILGVYCGQTTDSVPAMGTVCHRDSQWILGVYCGQTTDSVPAMGTLCVIGIASGSLECTMAEPWMVFQQWVLS